MFNYDSIKEFIEILYRERKIIDFLFTKRTKSVSYENLMSFVDYDSDKIEYLTDEEILLRTGNTIELNDELKEFFEKFSNATEDINNEYTDGLIKDLQTKTELFTAEKKPDKRDEYLLKIKSALRKIGKNILGNINQVRKNISNDFVTEKSYKIKKIKLDDYERKTKQIEGLINNINKLLKSSDWEYFVKIADDNVLLYIITDLRKDISLAWINFGDITQKIIDFHNQIRTQSDFYKKLQKIKNLKDKRILSENSNIEQILLDENSLLFSENQRFTTQLSIPYLQSDEAYFLLQKAKQTYRQKVTLIRKKAAGELSGESLKKKEKNVLTVSPANLKQLFTATNDELFNFINTFNFEQELTLEQKATLFCKIASQFGDELQHTGEFIEFEDVEYAVIKPKN